MKRLKKVFSLVLALSLILSLAVPAFAADITVTEVIPCKYNEAGDFSEGLAAVGMNDREYKIGDISLGMLRKWGYVDKTGKEVIPLKYDYAGPFSDGLAVVGVGDYPYLKYGYIDKTGREVVPCKYEKAEDFSEGLAAVKGGKSVDYKWGYIDQTGKEVLPCAYKDAGPFSEGLAAVELDEVFVRYGYIDKTGKLVLSFKSTAEGGYADAGAFSEGLAKVCVSSGPISKWGYIDKTGKEVVPCKYSDAEEFSEGLAVVSINDEGGFSKFGYIDKAGNEAVPCEYDQAYSFSEGLGGVSFYIADYGRTFFVYLDKTGKYSVNGNFRAGGSFSDGLAPAMLGYTRKYGYVDKAEKVVIPATYDYASSFSEGLAMVRIGDYYEGKCGFISVSGIPTQPEQPGTPDITVENIPASGTAVASTQTVTVDGKAVEFQMYALLDANGNGTNYIKLRDMAHVLNGTKAQFAVGYSNETGITVTTGQPYADNGSEMKTPFSGDRAYTGGGQSIQINGKAVTMTAINLLDDAGGGYNYFKLRDLGAALGFNVDWSAEKGIFVETDKPYNG